MDMLTIWKLTIKFLFLISVYTEKIKEKKSEIDRLQENINNANDAIADLHKQNESSKESCNAWV